MRESIATLTRFSLKEENVSDPETDCGNDVVGMERWAVTYFVSTRYIQ